MAEEVRTDEKICTMCGFEGICLEIEDTSWYNNPR